jgi:Zn-finger protein
MITFAEEPAERCAICKLYLLRHHREEWIHLTPADDGEKVWLCKECFNTPVEDIFMRTDGELPRKDVGLM